MDLLLLSVASHCAGSRCHRCQVATFNYFLLVSLGPFECTVGICKFIWVDLSTDGYLWIVMSIFVYFVKLLQVPKDTFSTCSSFEINLSSLHLAAAATATSLYCFHLSNFVGEVKEVDRVKEVKWLRYKLKILLLTLPPRLAAWRRHIRPN